MLKIEDSIEELSRIEECYNLNYHILESMADWVRVMDLTGKIIYANKSMQEALSKDMIGKHCDFDCENIGSCKYCIVEKSIFQGETIQKEEIIEGRYYSVKSSPVKDCNDNIIGAVEVFRDVTRERSLEMQLISKNRKMNKDLELARKIQQKILPKRGRFGNVEIDYLYKPSEMLSGDMFDIFVIDDENIGFYVSDVVGHGVSASMMTMFIRQSMRFIKDDILSPSIALSELHRRFLTLDFEMDKYFTIFYGVFNKRTYQLKYANAGHNSIPIKFNADREELEELKISGYPISLLFDNIDYKEKKIKLKKNDEILLYTDGILEMKDEDGVEFGIENIKNIIREENDLLAELKSKINNYSIDQDVDDFALLLMNVVK